MGEPEMLATSEEPPPHMMRGSSMQGFTRISSNDDPHREKKKVNLEMRQQLLSDAMDLGLVVKEVRPPVLSTLVSSPGSI